MGTYLENFLERVSTLPGELRRNFALLRELDARTQELVDQSERNAQQYLQSTRRALQQGQEPDTKLLKQIRQDHKTCLEYGDEKVALAVQTYELVDKHIRDLDRDLKKFEEELEQGDQINPEQETKSERKGEGKEFSSKGKARAKVEQTAPIQQVQSTKVTRKKSDPIDDARTLNVNIDMPIDPNEPTYCLCNRVSFGEMVGCDNPDCKIEWFHFECVGLTSPPKGKWYCPDCKNFKKFKIVRGEDS